MKQIKWGVIDKYGTLEIELEGQKVRLNSYQSKHIFYSRINDLRQMWNAQCDSLFSDIQAVASQEDIPSSVTDPVFDGSRDPLYGQRMDSADCGEN